MAMDTAEPEKDDKDRRGENPLLVQVFEEERIEGKMEPERRTLESLPAGTGVVGPEKTHFLLWEM